MSHCRVLDCVSVASAAARRHSRRRAPKTISSALMTIGSPILRAPDSHHLRAALRANVSAPRDVIRYGTSELGFQAARQERHGIVQEANREGGGGS